MVRVAQLIDQILINRPFEFPIKVENKVELILLDMRVNLKFALLYEVNGHLDRENRLAIVALLEKQGPVKFSNDELTASKTHAYRIILDHIHRFALIELQKWSE